METPIYGEKTPYFWTQNVEEVTENEFSVAIYNGNICHIRGINLLLRHGARYPNRKWLKGMKRTHERLKTISSVTDKYPFITDWKIPFSEEYHGILSKLGEIEMKVLGVRFGTRFKTLLDGNVDKIKFGVTYHNRTFQSFNSFIKGLCRTSDLPAKRPKPNIEERRLRFKRCRTLGITRGDIHKAKNDFKKGPEIQKAVQKVNENLGMTRIQLDVGDIDVIRHICALELGLYNDSKWLQLLDTDLLEYMEYMDDLEKYHAMGYGQCNIWKLALPFTSYMFERFNKAVCDSMFPVIDIGFSHHETILPLFTAFELFKDDQSLTADSFQANKDRQFCTSKIAPFSANIAIALYQCDKTSEFVVKMFVNEKAVIIPKCGKIVCPYEEFKREYAHLISW